VQSAPDNPYQSPRTEDSAANAKPISFAGRDDSWKAVLRRWEILRAPYNLIVGVAGLMALFLMPAISMTDALGGIVAYGLAANVMYLLGPAVELYLRWFAELGQGRIVPPGLQRIVRSRYVTIVLYVCGTAFSFLLTLFIGLAEGFAALPDQ
jgi:hypothetical protein